MGTHRTALALVLAVVAVTFGIGARRRSVRSAPCAAPTLTLSVSPRVACPAESVMLSWHTVDRSAIVTIEGVGNNLSSTGSTRITNGRRTFSAYAINSCGRGVDATVAVETPAPPIALISAPTTIREGNSATLQFTVSDNAHWVATSALGNSIFPDSGIGSDTATYSPTIAGTDGILLQCTGKCGFTVARSASVIVERSTSNPPPPPPPPPPGSGYLRCCDGTRSPTCTNCADKRGCCSNHGGVCGC